MKHNYPETRKPRTTEYAMSTKLLNKLGMDQVYSVWSEKGMYKAAEELSSLMGTYVSPYTVRSMSNKYNWKRVVSDKTLPIYRGVLAKTVNAEYYRHIEFN